MSLKTFTQLDFALVDGKYVSPGVCIEGTGAAVQITTALAATVTVQRAVNAKDFTTVPDFTVNVNGLNEFNISNAMPGQYIRIASTVVPTRCNILT